jgi:cell division protein FtsW
MSSSSKKAIDTPFLLALCSIVIAGLLIFTSAALSLLQQDGGATFTSVAVSQLLLGLVCGSIALIFFAKMDYRKWRQYSPYFFAFAFILTTLTFVPHIGLSLKGAARWIALGPLSFQPVEILKFASVMLLAAIYASHMRAVPTFRRGTLPLLLVAGSVGGLLMLQPDTADVIIVGMAATGVYFAAGGRISHIVVLALVGALAVGGAAFKYVHVADRLKTFINQEADPLGAGYQVQQSLIAVGSGGWGGRGFGQSIEKFSYLPEPIGDSIFAVAAEEFGFMGSTALVLLYVSIALLGLRIAARAPDPFGGLLVVGLITLIVGQSFFNIASAIGLVPLIGVPLIFVSHGGTALAISLAEVGVILSVSKRMKPR